MGSQLFSIAFLVWASISSSQASSFQSYQHETKAYELRFPAQWEIQKNFSGADLLIYPKHSSGFPPSCNLIAKLSATPLDPQIFYEKSFWEIESVPGFSKLERGSLPMAKEKIQWLSFLQTRGNQSFVTHSYLYARDHKSFVLTCTAAQPQYPKMKDLFHQIAGSFQLLDF